MLIPLPTLACEDWVAKVVAVEGAVQHKHGQQDWQPLQREQHICPGGSVKVGGNSRASLHLRNNTFARLDADSLLSFPVQTRERRFWVELRQGLAHFISRIVHEFEVSTPYVNAVVEGTEFVVAAQQGQGAVSVMEGKVTAYNEKSRASLTAGQQATSGGRDQDLSRFNVPADTLVEWAIHYPPVLSLAELPAQTAQDKDAIQQAIAALQQNRIDQALQVLDSAPASDVVQLARGTLLLQIGRMPEFSRTIEPLLQGPAAGLAHGLKSIAAVARNDIATGRASADIAVQLAPNSAAAWIALSYAQQAELQLNAALESARKATQVQSTSLLAHLRLSELYLAQGDVDAARDALEAIPEDVARGAELEGSKGFVQLFRLKLDSAREHFNRALAMDSSNPQYQLGLGLTLLRDGDLKAGRQHMEYAVSLDPLRSVLRSYLGRAYFEEKRDEVALEQWQLAKQFDPNDPTPYFYTGVHKLFANDPIGAVEELETSRDLNDKRAIYRSETLLQSDAASRSATLARAYGEVGYDQGVLLSGWDALRRDPTSSEGHRLLADYYAGDPRYETARVSELLQSQLWQPLSAYPLQPQLSEANLAVVAGAGPQRPGFNEYHSLFTQDGAYGMVNGYGGSDGTWGNDLVGSVLAGPVALSLGQYHYESDGWRDNADQEQDLYDGLIQWQINQSTSIQAEARKLDWNLGDLAPGFDQVLSRTKMKKIEQETYRVGLRHFFNPTAAVIASHVKQNRDISQQDEHGDLESSRVENIEGDSTEVQFSQRFSWFNVVVGAGYSKRTTDSVDASIESFIDPDDPGLFDVYSSTGMFVIEPEQKNAYVYVNGGISEWIDVALGLSYVKSLWVHAYANTETFEFFDLDGNFLFDFPIDPVSGRLEQDKDYWSPKLGLGFLLGSDLYLRLAVFKTVSRSLVADQTIEPTIFLGFNQLLDDRPGTEGENGAVGFDYRAFENLRVGGSYVRRSLVSPLPSIASNVVNDLEYKEHIFSAYANYLVKKEMSVSFKYLRDERKYDYSAGVLVAGLGAVRRSTLPVELELFAERGFSFGFVYTYHNQEIDSRSGQVADVIGKREKSAWVTDVFSRYRLPDRIGQVEVGVRNLLSEDDEFVRYDASVLEFYPSRYGYLKININY